MQIPQPEGKKMQKLGGDSQHLGWLVTGSSSTFNKFQRRSGSSLDGRKSWKMQSPGEWLKSWWPNFSSPKVGWRSRMIYYYIIPFLKRSPLQTIPKKAHGDSQNCQVQIYTLLQPPSDPQPSHREDKGGSYHSEWHIFVGEEFKHPNLGGGWTKPLDKTCASQIGSWNPNFPGENKKHLKPPPCYLNLKHLFGTSRDDSDHMISMPSLLGNM